MFGGIGGDGLMLTRFFWPLLLVSVGVALPTIAATKPQTKSAAKSERSLRVGDKWSDDKEAQLSINWNNYGENDPINESLIRKPFIDDVRSKISGSVVPMTRKKLALASVYFTVKMTAATTGKITACSLRKAEYDSAAVAPASAYFCTFMVKQGYIHPPLDLTGKRIAITGFFETSYSASTKRYRPIQTGPDGKELVDQRQAAPTVPITLASLNFTDVPATAKGKKAGLILHIASSGQITKCDLYQPTFVDSIDVQLCARMADVTFTPALDHNGIPKHDFYIPEIQF
jgi:hypothetical protein